MPYNNNYRPNNNYTPRPYNSNYKSGGAYNRFNRNRQFNPTEGFTINEQIKAEELRVIM